MRHLLPHYFVSTHPLGWKCSECDQPFSLIVPETATTADIPESVIALFNSHKCRIRRPDD
jgi:hypothetical protein